MTSLAFGTVEPPVSVVAASVAARAGIWAEVLARACPAPARLLVVGDTPLVAGWIAAAPRGVRVESVGAGPRAVDMVDLLLGRDRFGEIGAVVVALAGDPAAAAATVAGLRAVIERSFHDARLLADWPGAEDEADFAAADLLVAEASCWLDGAAGAVVRRLAA